MKKSLTDLLIELNEVNAKLERIKNDPDYINSRVDDIFKGKKYTETSVEDISKMLEEVFI